MQNIFEIYIQSISKKYSHKDNTEMGYRTDFENLLKGIFETINVSRIDHDAKAKQGNKPDFIVHKFDVPLLYIEVKDIGVSLDKIEKSEQIARYFGYENLILSDYVEFRFFRNGKKYDESIKIAEYDLTKRTIKAIPENFERAKNTIIDFTKSHKESIKTGEHLSKIMGGKAQRIRDNVRHFLSTESEKNSGIKKVYETIKKLLVHDLNVDSFSDMYAQTLVYGLFVARFHDQTPDNFTRLEARDLVPVSNPLLRHFFDHIVGMDFDKRLESIVNELCLVFSHANVSLLMEQYFKEDMWGESHERPDPVIHFYEDFLKEYDPGLRKKLGAFYTPLPVVRFIVRSVDYLLEKEFGLADGLADTSKLPNGKHKVQILDPATGTGTFMSAAVQNIYKKLADKGQKGRWTKYVHNDLLPRLHGFELMMAPYTIAHLKLSMEFKKTGFTIFHRRLGIYLTNSLEESSLQSNIFDSFGFAESIAEESQEAAKIKNEVPIMVVLGNPPYSVSSSNKGVWIQNLMKVYKENLNEKNIQPLSDDYIKFIRFAEHFVEKNESGIVAMITNNSFLDGIIHRQMRKHLLETFDDIYILDLHGNSKKKEKSPDGSKDENVFDIMQGVSISIYVRKSVEKKGLATVFHSELFGKREMKFKGLNSIPFDKIKWQKLIYSEPYYFFVKKDFESQVDYKNGFAINELFQLNSSGIKTHDDDNFISFDKYEDNNQSYLYRPLDIRNIEYDLKKIVRHRFSKIKHMLKENLSLISCRNQVFTTLGFVSKNISDIRSFSNPGSIGTDYVFPLYLYDENNSRIPNLKKEIVDEIEKLVGKVTPEDIFDYVYAVLHSPNYREKYKEFLKIDFPRVPYPNDKTSFKKLVGLGTELRLLHLLESPKVNNYITTYPIEGSDEVVKVVFNENKVFINKEQYFGNVMESVWNFYIGGYQPAQKWMKDRKTRTLNNEDIEHYQKMVVALTETERIMKEIDKVISL